MPRELRFDDKVAIVTGAGNGLGRAHALLLAARGAQVVVNDLGGGIAGGGKSSNAADVVVAEIKKAGGTAVANYDSVVDGDKIVQTAMDEFGRIDIVVNNAGILRDSSFAKMSEADWDLVYEVHVKGSYKVTAAAWPHMREQKYGRIVMTASAAGIYGNFGQANYSMAKLGVTGFANTLAREGGNRNIFANTIAPLAGSRLTETVLPEDLVKALKPEYVSPLVAWLCHQDCKENGSLFEVGGGYFGKLRWERTEGKTYRVGRNITPETISGAWKTITDFGKSTHPADVNESLAPILANVSAGESKGGNEFIDVDEALGHEFEPTESSYDERDLALYALGVGAGDDPYDDKDLQLVYEMHGSGFKAIPSYAVIPAVNQILGMAKEGKAAPGFHFGLDRLLHGEQYTEVVRPLPRHATLTHKSNVKRIYDKGKNALITYETKSYDENDNLMIVNELTAVIRGAGGWGGDRGSSEPVNVAPERKPDVVVEQRIGANQALLYRLSGDWNPLHVDPNMAKAFGFEKPILHGLCTFGHATRHVISGCFPDADPRLFKSIKVRFADSVYPGETLITEMWKDGETRVIFRCKVKERDKVVISNAAIERYEEIPKAAATQQVAAPEVAPTQQSSEPDSADIFVAMRDYVERNPDIVSKIGVIFQFKLKDPDSVWTLDAKNGQGSVDEGETQKPECTLELSDADFLAMTQGKLDAQKLYFSGKLKITGNVMASQKLTFLQKIDPEQAKEAVLKARAEKAAGGGKAAPKAVTKAKMAVAPVVLEKLAGFAASNAKTVADVNARMQWNVSDPAMQWAVDFRSGVGTAVEGVLDDADVTFTLSDEDLSSLVSGDESVQDLYQRGKLRIDGDISVAQRLGFLKNLEG